MATIVLAGSSSLLVMPRLEDPVLSKRVAVISTLYPGSDPQTIESSITIPIEQAINSIPQVKRIRSNTRKDISNVVIELRDEVTNTDSVWKLVEKRLAGLTRLPEGSQPPELSIFPLKAYAAILALIPKNTDESSWIETRRLGRHLQDRILAIDGTENVRIFGAGSEEISILVKPETVAATGLSTGRIAAQIQAQNSYTGGRIILPETSLSIDVPSDRRLIQRLEYSKIEYRPDREPAALSEISDVRRQMVQPEESIALVNDQRVMVLAAMVNNDSRVDLWTSDLVEQVETFQIDFPGDYSIEPLFLQSRHIHSRLVALLKNLMLTTIAVVLVVFLMMGWRCMLIVAVSLPLAALSVIIGMRVLEIPIHQMSITGLIVALGLLIDNAIVMVEEVRSRIYSGRKSLAAMIEAVNHLRLPLFGSTLTTVLAFLPIALLPGPSGEFVGSIAVSVILAISSSFLVSMLLVPPLVPLVGVDESRLGFMDFGLSLAWLESSYRWTLKSVFQFPIVGVLLGVALPLFGFYSSQFLPRQFFPATDRQQVQVEIELAASSSIVATEKCVQSIRELIAKDHRIERQCWFLGESAPTFYYNVIPSRVSVPSYAQAFLDVAESADVSRLVNDLQQVLDQNIHHARIVVRELSQGPPVDAPMEIRIFGDDLDQLNRLGSDVRAQLSTQPTVVHTRSDLEDTIPQFDFLLDDSVASSAQTNRRDLARFLFASIDGAPVGNVYLEGQEIQINVQIDYTDRSVIQMLSALPATMVSKPAHETTARNRQPAFDFFTVGSLGEFELDADVAAIIRIDGRRVNEVKAYLQAGVLPSTALSEFREQLTEAEFKLPEGYEIQFGGETEQRSHAVSALMATAVTLFSIMLLSLVAVLGSVRNTLIIAAVGGLSVGLAQLSLYLTGFPLGFMAIVGTMGLIGIAINDSIVVLAAIRANQRLPNNDQRDLADVVSGCTRHILATTFTTMIGFMPLVIYGGKFWPPLAIVIAAGVGGATILALYFVPSLHKVLNLR